MPGSINLPEQISRHVLTTTTYTFPLPTKRIISVRRVSEIVTRPYHLLIQHTNVVCTKIINFLPPTDDIMSGSAKIGAKGRFPENSDDIEQLVAVESVMTLFINGLMRCQEFPDTKTT